MYISTERLALANREVRDTFRNSSIAWQAIPHWDTGDPGQTRVPNGDLKSPNFVKVRPLERSFQVSLAQANAPTPDPLLTEVIAATVKLASKFDNNILPNLYTAGTPDATGVSPQALLNKLIDARAAVEDAGYRAPSCLIVNRRALKALNTLVGGQSVLDQLLVAANINSLHRATRLRPGSSARARLVLIGRRQRIAHGSAAGASPGEEPVDLAVSVMPSIEIIGETPTGEIELSVRIRFATRIKDNDGLDSKYKK